MTTHNIKGFKPPKKGAWLGIFQPKWQNYKIVISPAGNIGSIPNFDRVIKPHRWLRGWSRITKFIFKMADGQNVGNAITCLSMERIGWNLGGHGNGHCLATAHWTFSSYGRLEAERMNQFWWNLVHDSKLEPKWQSRDQTLKFLKFKMADGRHVGKYSKCYNSPRNGPTETQLGWSHPIISPTCPPRFGCHGNARCLATV